MHYNREITIENPKTNADRIRSMTDEELAEWMRDNIDCGLCSNIFGEPQPCMRGNVALIAGRNG